MPNTRLYYRSFAGGEISPEMFGRIDDVKYQSGLQKAKNVIVKPYGPVSMRPGFRYVNSLKNDANKSRLIPFKYSLTQSLIVELGNAYIRFHANGATLSSASAPTLQRYNNLDFTNASASITVGAHAFQVNDAVQFSASVAGFVLGQVYYISSVGPTTVTLKSQITSTTPIEATATVTGSPVYIGKTYYVGDIVSYSGFKYSSNADTNVADTLNLPSGSASNNTKWYYCGDYIEIQSPYAAADVFDITYVQSNDIITLCHPNYAPRELRRYSDYRYALVLAQFGSPIAAPATVQVVAERGQKFRITGASQANPCVVTVATTFQNQLTVGETFYIDEVVGMTQLNGRFYSALAFPSANSVQLRNHDGQDWVNSISYGAWTSGGVLQIASPLSDVTSKYKVTSFSSDLVESDPSLEVSATNNLNINGSYNTLSWFPVSGASRYNVYKEQNGLYGYVGQVDAKPTKASSTVAAWLNTGSYPNKALIPIALLSDFAAGDVVKFTGSVPTGITAGTIYYITAVTDVTTFAALTLSATLNGPAITFSAYPTPGNTATMTRHFAFVDDNIAPDMGQSPPTRDAGLFASANNYPRAVTYFEQRKCFAGTLTDPQTVWMTKSGTESDMSYSIPSQDNDRIKFKLSSRDANVARHLVPMDSMLMLTNSTEWRVTSVNSDAITPTSISVRPQAYVGSNNVQPWIVNNSILFCAARGGHLRELGYDPQVQSYRTGDLSIRASHLFDDYDLLDMCVSKAPIQIVWAVSSSGKLLGFTYVPEEQVGAWHQHETDGVFESCASIPEGDEDSLYVVVKRNVNGTEKRFIEQLDTILEQPLSEASYLDCSLRADGTSSGSVGMTLTSPSSSWVAGATLLLTAASASFLDPQDVGDQIWFYTSDGVPVKMTITQVLSTTTANATCLQAIPAEMRGGTRTDWAWARNSFSGLSHLNGKDVSVVADGVYLGTFPVALGGVTLSKPAVNVCIGLAYTGEIKTLPASLQIDGYGQGRTKNISRAWLRMRNSYGVKVGPSPSKLKPLHANVGYAESEQEQFEVLLDPSWQKDGVVLVRQDEPFPFTVIGLTFETSVGA